MKSADVMVYAKIGAVILGGIVIYKTYKTVSGSVGTAAEKVSNAAKKIVTEDMNPASDKNIIYSALPDSWKESLVNIFEKVLGPPPVVQTAGVSLSVAVANSENAARKAAKDRKFSEITQVEMPVVLDNGIIVDMNTGGATGSW